MSITPARVDKCSRPLKSAPGMTLIHAAIIAKRPLASSCSMRVRFAVWVQAQIGGGGESLS